MKDSDASRFATLLSPVRAGRKTLRNRVIMGSMHTRLESEPDGIARQVAFYAERARGEAAIVVTGGFSPNAEGIFDPEGPRIDDPEAAMALRPICEAVQAEGSLICAQLLHAGRYAKIEGCVAPSPIRSPINRFTPREMTEDDILRTIADFASAAANAQAAGFDGVEIMGSEGYLINEFIASRTNQRDDDWGGDYQRRMRFPVEIVRRVRERVGPDFIIIYRLSMLDLVEGGSTLEEVIQLAQAIEAAGATIINTGIGWHEARIPTIATKVPRAAFAWVTKQLMGKVGVPLVATNRINTPEVAEAVLASGACDMVSMARPFLADAEFVRKARQGRAEDINTCIGCNQACLDHIFSLKITSCLVNPRACHETEIVIAPTAEPKSIAVVGAGPAGLAFATTAAERGHRVTLFEAEGEIGGQFNIAKTIPGKEEFHETLRYFGRRLDQTGVEVKLNTRVSAEALAGGGFDEIVLATGILPRRLEIEGADHPKALSYLDVLKDHRPVGKSVAIVGAGGIGFDVAEYITHGHKSPSLNPEVFFAEWGVDTTYSVPGGLIEPNPPEPERDVWLLQRKTSKVGAGLGKTTGWIHRAGLAARDVAMMPGVAYERIDDEGLHLTVEGQPRTLAVDTVIVCAGQEPSRGLYAELQAKGIEAQLIGGADVAAELDAKRAIHQGVTLAAAL